MGLDEILWPDWTAHRRRAHIYAIRVMAHRIRKFGFEECVNSLDPKSLLIFGLCVHEPFASKCIRRAIACDPTLSSTIEAPVCPTSSTTAREPRSAM